MIDILTLTLKMYPSKSSSAAVGEDDLLLYHTPNAYKEYCEFHFYRSIWLIILSKENVFHPIEVF